MIAEIKSLKFFFADYLLQNCSDQQLEEILSLSREMEKLRNLETRKNSGNKNNAASKDKDPGSRQLLSNPPIN